MRLSKNRSASLPWLLGRKLNGRNLTRRRALSAICFLVLLVALASAWPAHAGEAPPTNHLAVAEPNENPTNGLGNWIWAEQTLDRQIVQFWRSFEVLKTAVVTHSGLRMRVENEYKLLLDGRKMGCMSE